MPRCKAIYACLYPLRKHTTAVCCGCLLLPYSTSHRRRVKEQARAHRYKLNTQRQQQPHQEQQRQNHVHQKTSTPASHAGCAFGHGLVVLVLSAQPQPTATWRCVVGLVFGMTWGLRNIHQPEGGGVHCVPPQRRVGKNRERAWGGHTASKSGGRVG